jgi:hypothetical protein
MNRFVIVRVAIWACCGNAVYLRYCGIAALQHAGEHCLKYEARAASGIPNIPNGNLSVPQLRQ